LGRLIAAFVLVSGNNIHTLLAVNREGARMVYNWIKFIQFWLFPPACLLCEAPGMKQRDLCPGCYGDLPKNSRACHICALPLESEGALVCGQCLRDPPPFDKLVAPFVYDFPFDVLIRALKFHGRLPAARLLGDLLGDCLERRRAPLPECIVPVPLHPARLRERGFNQSLEIARPLAKRLGVPIVIQGAQRTRPTPPQSGLDQKARRTNVRGVFAFKRPPGVKHVAVLDDVVTTGSTVAELARVLRDSGVERVDVWACARTGR
jgi:ComF family protein